MIEVLEVDGDRLRFRRRLIDPRLTTPNDVVARPDGHVSVTNTGPAQGIGGFLSMLLGLRRGNVAHFDGRRWTIAAREIAYANGVVVNASSAPWAKAAARVPPPENDRQTKSSSAGSARSTTILANR